jgi:hypothetical protein
MRVRTVHARKDKLSYFRLLNKKKQPAISNGLLMNSQDINLSRSVPEVNLTFSFRKMTF